MTAYVDNQVIESLIDHTGLRYNASIQATANSTNILTSSSTYMYIYTGTTAGQIIRLPDATTLSNGRAFQFWDNSTQQISLRDNGSNILLTQNPGQRITAILRDNSTTNGIWVYEVTSGSTLSGIIAVNCSYTASANTGRYLEFYPSNPSDVAPFLILANSTIVALSVVSTAASTGTVSIFKTSNLVTSITSISLAASATNSATGLNVSLTAGDSLSVRITSGSILKPGVSIYIAST